MAQSPAHRLGQIIGDELEAAVQKPSRAIATEFGVFLDSKHSRPARGGKKKVVWEDSYGNTHELDYVLEEGGSEDSLGSPRAFIETAWRRYTKHSRNKAQEIQGAIVPLADTYREFRPFLGAVLAGTFTSGSIEQLRSHNFNLAYCPYETVVRAFMIEGVDVSSDEDTEEDELEQKVAAFDLLKHSQRESISEEILRLHAHQFDPFFDTLRLCLNREIEHIFILTLSGASRSFDSIDKAVRFISEHDQSEPESCFVRYELNVRYSNGDEVRAKYSDRDRAICFLRRL